MSTLSSFEIEALARRFLQQREPCREVVTSTALVLRRVLQEEGFGVAVTREQVFVATDSGFALRTTLQVLDPVGSAAPVGLQLEMCLERKGRLGGSAVLRLLVTPDLENPRWGDRLNHVDLVASHATDDWDCRRDCIPELTEKFEQALERMGCVMDDETARRYSMLLTHVLQP